MIARLYISLFLFFPFVTLSQEVISSNGNYNPISNGSVSWTIGEPIVHTSSTSNHIVSQGFQQNYEDFLVGISEVFLSDWHVYPNPFSREILISDENLEEIQMHDINGKEIMNLEIHSSNGITKIQLPEVAEGVYILSLSNRNQTIIQKIIKSNN